MSYDIGPRIGIEGEANFKKAITDINKDLSVLGSEMKKVTAQFDGNANSMEALTAKQDVYNKQADEQRKKIETMTAALEGARKEFGENSTQVKNWQIKLNNAEADLAKTENAIKQTTQQIDNFGKEASDGGNEVEKAGKKAKSSGDDAEKGQSGWSKLGNGLKGVGKVAGEAVLALGAAAAGAATAIGAMTVKAAYGADDINTLAKQTGLSTEEIQKFKYASQLIDVPLETLTGSMAKLTKNMESARLGSKNQAAAFEDLGISITDNEGKLRSNQDVFEETIRALGKMENETQRDAYAMQIFGKSAQQLNPLILGGADALKKLGDEADAAGLILKQDALDNLNQLSDAMDTFKATVSGSGSLFATAFAGPMAEGLNTITGYIQELASAFNEGGFDGLADKAGEVLSNVITKITESLPRIIELGTSVIFKLLEGIVQNIPALVTGASAIMGQLTGTIIEMLPMLIDAAMQIIVTLAASISEALPELIPAAVEAVLTIVETLIDNIDMLIDAAIAIIMALAEGLIEALPKLIEKAPVIITKLIEAITENLPKIMEAGIQILITLIGGIIASIPDLVMAIPDIIAAIISGFGAAAEKIFDIGSNIVKGVWEGIKAMATWIKDKVSGFFSGIVDGVKGLLGIKSPSKVFAGIGENMAAGLGEGFGAEMRGVAKQINDSVPTTINSQINATAKMGEGIVNGMAALIPQGGVYNINLMLPDGTSLANVIFDPLKGVIRQRGVAPV